MTTLPTQHLPRPANEVIWSRGGGSFRRMVWKEASEVIEYCGVFVAVILVTAVLLRFDLANSRANLSWPMVVLEFVPSLFLLLVGSRTFAREFETGTWELLRSAGASSVPRRHFLRVVCDGSQDDDLTLRHRGL